MEAKLAKIANILKDVTTADWKVRVEAIKELRAILGDIRCIDARALLPNLAKQIGDGRSLVMQEACETARAICFAFGAEPEFPPIADILVKTCLPIVPSSTKVMSEAAKSCLKQVVLATTRGFQSALDRFIQNAQGGPGKAATLRLECVRLIDLCMNEWDSEWLLRGDNIKNLDAAIQKALHDADSDVRTAARMAFTTFARVFPEDARRSWKNMDSDNQQRFQDLFPQQTVSRNPTLMISSAVKRTPCRTVQRPALAHTATKNAASTVRKPLQMVSLNTTTPTSTRRVPKTAAKEMLPPPPPPSTVSKPSVSFASLLTLQTPSQTRPQTHARTARDRLVKSLVGMMGRHDSEEATARMVHAMKEMAEIFCTNASELQIDDFMNCEGAIASCVFNLDEKVCAVGMDALGTFVWALARSKGGLARERENLMQNIVSRTFSVALQRTASTNDQVAKAALRAVDTCAMFVSKNMLLSYVLHYAKTENDDALVQLFAAIVDDDDEQDVEENTFMPADQTPIDIM